MLISEESNQIYQKATSNHSKLIAKGVCIHDTTIPLVESTVEIIKRKGNPVELEFVCGVCKEKI